MKTSRMLLVGASLLSLAIPSVTHAQNTTTGKSFSDVPANHWAAPSVEAIAKAGIVTGYPNAKYNGKQTLTRDEFAVAISRLLTSTSSHETDGLATKDDVTTLHTDMESKIDSQKSAIDDLHHQLSGMKEDLTALDQNIAGTSRRVDTLQSHEKSTSKNNTPVTPTKNSP